MRFGLFLNEPKGPDALGKLRERVALGADDGFSSVWVSNIFGLDALTALAVVGSQVPGHRARHRRRADLPPSPGGAGPAGAHGQRRRAAGGSRSASGSRTRS